MHIADRSRFRRRARAGEPAAAAAAAAASPAAAADDAAPPAAAAVYEAAQAGVSTIARILVSHPCSLISSMRNP